MRLVARLFRSTCLLLLFVVSARPAAAGIDRFTPFGPMNGTFESLAVDPRSPTTLLAAVDLNGVYRSDDAGRTWAWSGIGLGTALPRAIAADPANDERFYAISDTQVFGSSDRGRHWAVFGTGQNFTMPFVFDAAGNLSFPKLAVLPGSPATLLVGAGPYLQRSTDGGTTWSRVYSAGGPETGWSLAVDPADPRRVWAGLFTAVGGGVIASTDAGQTWTRLTTFPNPFGAGAAALIALPAPPGQPATLLVSARGASTQAALFKSTDDGQTWRQVALSEPALAVTALAYEPQTPSIVYAAAVNSLFVSSDAGETWRKRGAGIAPQIGLSALVAAPGTRTVYGLGSHDLVVSPDRGRHTSITAQSGHSPFFPPTFHFLPDPTTIYVVLGGKVSKSSDGGATWASFATNPAPPDLFLVNDLAIDPADPKILYIATQSGIFRTSDGGASWSLLAQVQFSRLQLVGRKLALAADCGVSRSTDGGRTWKRTLACDTTLPGDFEGRTVDRLLLAPHEPGVVYAQVTDVIGRHPPMPNPQVWKSADSGVIWKQIVPDGMALALDPNRPGRLYVSRLAGIERSDDGGRTFRLLSGLTALDLLVDPATPTTLYAAVGQGGVSRSTDSGVTWEPINAGLPRYVIPPWNADQLAINPAVPHLLYVVVNGWILQNQLSEP
jgi:photosystem II stability/assembly factor-like uncharacterized protein